MDVQHDYPHDPYTRWCQEQGCEHGHCSRCEQEHPQPVQLEDGRLVCGACLHCRGVVSEMVPCVPEVC